MIFYDRFEEVASICNDGEGMSGKEMLLVLKTNLYRKIYENVHRQKQHRLNTEKGPSIIYKAIKARHMQFCESFIERQFRYKKNWELFHRKQGMSAHQFEAAWEEIHTDLEEVGLPVSAQDKYLGYLQKIGAEATRIRMDRRDRVDLAAVEGDPDSPPPMKNRPPETWEECHAVLVELEAMDAGTKQFLKAGRSGGGKGEKGKEGQPVGGERGTKGKGTGKSAKGPCFSFRDTGRCNNGANCPYDHTPEATGRIWPSGKFTKKKMSELQGFRPAYLSSVPSLS